MTRFASRAMLLALVLGAGCTSDPSQQVLTGRVTTSGAIAVRAVSGSQVVTATQVRSDGSFTLALPADGVRYRLEVLTTSGVRHVFSSANGSLADLTFRVCQPTDPYDMGGIGGDPGTGTGGGMGEPGWPGCDQTDPNCQPTKPCDVENGCPPCMDPTDPNCGGTTCGPNEECPSDPPPCSDPMDPNCPWPQPCAAGDPTCTEPCADPMDPNCKPCANPMDPTCGLPPTPGCNDPMDPYCFCSADGSCPDPWCSPVGIPEGPPNSPDPGVPDQWCPPPPPDPCLDPTDPQSCKNPCEIDPMSCGCAADDLNCWPTPVPPDCDAMGTMCDPNGPGGMTPEKPPGDFGCTDGGGTGPDEPTMPPDDTQPGKPNGP